MPDVYQDNPLKCEEAPCWHIKGKDFIYCKCCLYGRCYEIPERNRILAPTEVRPGA